MHVRAHGSACLEVQVLGAQVALGRQHELDVLRALAGASRAGAEREAAMLGGSHASSAPARLPPAYIHAATLNVIHVAAALLLLLLLRARVGGAAGGEPPPHVRRCMIPLADACAATATARMQGGLLRTLAQTVCRPFGWSALTPAPSATAPC